MTQPAIGFFEAAMPYVLTCLGSILIILISILLKKLAKIDELGNKFNEHILNFTRVVANLVTFPACDATRAKCIELNKTIIQQPLQKQLDEHIADEAREWEKYEEEAEQLWLAVNHHVHTDRGVVIDYQRRNPK